MFNCGVTLAGYSRSSMREGPHIIHYPRALGYLNLPLRPPHLQCGHFITKLKYTELVSAFIASPAPRVLFSSHDHSASFRVNSKLKSSFCDEREIDDCLADPGRTFSKCGNNKFAIKVRQNAIKVFISVLFNQWEDEVVNYLEA